MGSLIWYEDGWTKMKEKSEESVLTVTSKASQLISEYFNKREKQPIRIFVGLGGCGIRTFGIALERPGSTDIVFEIEGYTYVINKKLLNLVKPVLIDSDGIGFRMSGCGIAPPQGCGSCGNMCGVRGGTRCPGDCFICKFQCNQSLKRRNN